MTEHAQQAASLIQQQLGDWQPKVAIALGSGLSPLAKEITLRAEFKYDDLPGFPECSVEGHQGSLLCGEINGTPVACLNGRAHYYENVDYNIPKTMVRTLKLLGCDTYLATNASGSFRAEVPPGFLVAINDHINFQCHNPLVGPNDDAFGPRFIGMENTYNKTLREAILATAAEANIDIAEGVYLGVLGPSFETPAEIRMFRQWGADVVGMSTIPEVICAHHCGMNVAVIAVITNLAAGMGTEPLSHEVTLAGAKQGSANLVHLVRKVLQHDAFTSSIA
tara:strand:+ start:3597 stop:4433 length:837 start_codon:yes stop_codon:yes gene_type:complete